MNSRGSLGLAGLALVALAACQGAAANANRLPGSTTSTSTTSTTAAPAPSATTSTTAPATSTTTTVPRPVVHEQFTPFATVGGITLLHPSDTVERIGFHQSNHEGAQSLDVLPTAVAPSTMETRDRLTSARTAADIVVDPASAIRAPVSGVVKRAGSYTLYCKYTDSYAVIAPDAHPDWEVKILHVVGLSVRRGQRVTAGQTVVAAHAHQFPFKSEVDDLAVVQPAWPHVHIEVDDPSIPNRPNPGSGGCS